MIALYIILGIVLLITLLCFVKLEFFATYSSVLTLRLRVLFFTFTLVPVKKKKKAKAGKKPEKKKQDKKDKKEKKPSYLKKLSDKKGISGLVSIFLELSKLVGTTLKGLAEHTVVRKLDIDITIVGEDAADTALKYGKLCGLIYSAVAVVCGVTKCESYTLNVTPDFDDEASSKVSCDSRFYIRAFYVLKYALIALYKLLVIRYKR